MKVRWGTQWEPWKAIAEGLEDTSFVVVVVVAVNGGPYLAWVQVAACDPWESNGKDEPCLVRAGTCLGARKGRNANVAPGAFLEALILVLGAYLEASSQIRHYWGVEGTCEVCVEEKVANDFRVALYCPRCCRSPDVLDFAPSFVVSSAEIEVVVDFAVLLGTGIASLAYSAHSVHFGNWMDFACLAYEEAQTYWEAMHNQEIQRNLGFGCLGSYQRKPLQETCHDACQEGQSQVAGCFGVGVAQGRINGRDA